MVERPGHRRRLTAREQALGVLVGLWMVVGLFLDGWAHHDGRTESFFTPWHAVLYSGFGAAVVVALGAVDRSRGWREPQLPEGHGLTLLALAAFGAGAVGDLVWHQVFGIEVAVEALLSPTHLLLLVSGIVALSGTVRASWRRDDEPTSLTSFLPALLCLALITAVAGFFLGYLSPFVNHAAGQPFDPRSIPHEHPSHDVGELRQLLGLASILTTTLLLAVPTYVVLHRWRPPRGSFTVLFGVVGVFFVAMDEFDQVALIFPALAAGLWADALAGRLPPSLTVASSMLVLWPLYFATFQLTEDGGVRWSAELIAGAPVLAALVAGALGLVGRARARGADLAGSSSPSRPRSASVGG